MASNANFGVAAVGDVLDINCWSSTPYHFYYAGRKKGMFKEPWSLNLEEFNSRRKFWNAKQLILGRGKGGFQYSVEFLSAAEQQITSKYFESNVISFNQVFPRASSVIASGGKIYYYIDATLSDLFRSSEYGITVPSRMKKIAIQQEKDNYEQAEAIISMGSWVHDSLLGEYNLPATKVFKILPGANIELPANFSFTTFKPGAGIDREFVLGFVGKDWKRKGLLLLIDVVDSLTRKGIKAKLKVIGNAPEELMNRANMDYTGFIDKRHNQKEFVEAISSCDLGCLFSSTEALGISTLEFLRVGVPVAGFYHQGLKDTLMEGASLRFAPTSSAIEIADGIEGLIRNNDYQEMLKQMACRYSEQVTWDQCIVHFQNLLYGS